MSTKRDRLYIEKSDRKVYDRLKRVDSPFKGKGNKELFVMAMILGFGEGGTKELNKKEGYVRTAYLTDEEKSLIKAIAIDKVAALDVLLDKEKVYSIAEQYAAYGIRLLHDRVFSGEYGTYAKRLESELVQVFEENRKPKRPKPEEQKIVDIRELIDVGENEKTEFKSSMCWDYKKNQKNKLVEYTIAKTVSAFMNSEGGYLFIGIGNDKQVLGLDKDFAVIRTPSKDGYELHFTNLINKYLGKENRPYAKIWFETLDGKIIAVVKVNKCPNPVYIESERKEEFYIRLGNSSHPLNVREATTYIKNHWQ